MIKVWAPPAVALVDSVELQRLQVRNRLELRGYRPVVFAGATELLMALSNGRRFELLLLVEEDFLVWNCLSSMSRVQGIPTLLLTRTLDWLTQLAPGQHFQASPLFDFSLQTAGDAELDVRIRSLLQRGREQRLNPDRRVTVGDYTFLEGSQLVIHREREIMMQPRQFGVALELFCNVGAVVSRESLWMSHWGKPLPRDGTRTLDVCVANVRRKLDLREENGFTVHAVYRRGYQVRARSPHALATVRLAEGARDAPCERAPP